MVQGIKDKSAKKIEKSYRLKWTSQYL